jgi:hypothetical protein
MAVQQLIPSPPDISYNRSYNRVLSGLCATPSIYWSRGRRAAASPIRRADAAQLRIDRRGEDKRYPTLDASERYSLAVKDDAVTVLPFDAVADVTDCGRAVVMAIRR